MVRVSGDLGPAAVWERYTEPARWTGWAPHLRAVRCADPRLRVGTTGTVHGPLGVRARFRVTAVDERARTWAWSVRCGPVRVHLAHGVEPTPGASGTTTWLRLTGPAPVVLAYAPLARAALRRLVTR